MVVIYHILALLITLYLGQSLLRNGIKGIKEKDKPFWLYDPRLNVVIGIFCIIIGIITFIKLIMVILS